MSRCPEILAPAGSHEALVAAVAAGADAVYFGLKSWSARARAENFDDAALAEALSYLHQHGRRGYVAINTLVFDHELDGVERAVRACANAGVDAIIVQDLGVLRLARAIAPDMPIHASTQMTCTDAASVELAASLGAARVILARELSLDDIAQIRGATDVELEVFVHGALCVAYSGQCLTSEAIGGRSANRGACAQACRLPYDLVVDGALRDTGDRAFLLSPEDLEASALVERLAALGVCSLKIEGRLKGPAYVAATTALYRSAVDALRGAPNQRETKADPSLRESALATFSRGSGPGFLLGVDHQRLVEGRGCDHRGRQVGEVRRLVHEGPKGSPNRRTWVHIAGAEALQKGDGLLIEGGRAAEGEVGGRVWLVREAKGGVEVWLGPDKALDDRLVGRRVFLSNDAANERRALATAAQTPAKTTVDLTLRASASAPPALEGVLSDGKRAEVIGEMPMHTATPEGAGERADSRAKRDEAIASKLGRLGDTPFALGRLTVEVDDGVMVAPSALNRLRRSLVEALLKTRANAWTTTDVSASALLERAGEAVAGARGALPGGLVVLCRSLDQARAALKAGAAGVWLDFLELTGLGNAVRALRAEDASSWIGVAPPRIRKPGEEKIDDYLERLGPNGVLVRSLGALHAARALGGDIVRIGDFSLNVTNRLTASEVLRRLAGFTPSHDLDAAQLMALLSTHVGPFAEVVLHQPMPLFHMEHCVFARELSSGKDHRDCGRPCEKHELALRDRAGMEHPVIADVGCRNTVFHAKAQSAASLVPAMKSAGVARFRVELVREDAAQTEAIVRAYTALIEGRRTSVDVVRSLQVEGSYGVVRGSLRVLNA